MKETMENGSERMALERLNQEYVTAFMNSDVEWYRQHLADEFVCIESDGSLLTREEFLSNTAKGPDVADYSLESVAVKIYGEAALIRATGVWHRKDGTVGLSRYIDVWVKQNAQWKAVSAQITRTTRRVPRGRYKR
jgi:hypothetical protein